MVNLRTTNKFMPIYHKGLRSIGTQEPIFTFFYTFPGYAGVGYDCVGKLNSTL